MTKSKILVALSILFATATVVLVYAVMDSSVSYTYCADELERLTRRRHNLVRLMGSLQPKLTKGSLDAAVRKAGLHDEAFPKGPNEIVVSDVSFVFDDAGVLKEVSLD